MRSWQRKLPRYDEWNVGIVDAPIHAFLDPRFQPQVRWLPRVRGTFVADPFALELPGGAHLILCEEWDVHTRLGRLVSIDHAGQRSPLEGFPFGKHHSYPFVIADQGNIFCVPECCVSGSVHLYRLRPDQPGQWVHETVLLDGVAGVDATVFQHNGLWWLACTLLAPQPQADLYLFWAPRLHGPWLPHLANPVKRDAASSRPGGTPFYHNGELYRPAQDCSNVYGGAVVLNHVTRLDHSGFTEHPIRRLSPPPNWHWHEGWHTLSSAGDRTLIDAKRSVVITHPLAFRRELFRLVRARFRPAH